MKRILLAASAALLLGGCAFGQLAIDPPPDLTLPGICRFEMFFEIIQNGKQAASVDLDNTLGSKFNDNGVNYLMPLRIHVYIKSSTACPPELQQGRNIWWPGDNSVGTLARQSDGRYRVDMSKFVTHISPGFISTH